MAPCYSCASQDLDRSTRLHRRGQMSDGSFMAEFPRGVSVWTLMRHHDIAPAYFDEHACTQCGWTTGISRCNWCNAALCEWHRRMSDQARRKGAHVKGGSTCSALTMQRAGPGAWTSRIACGIGGRPPHSSHLPVSEVMGESLSNKTGVSGATQTDQLGNNKKTSAPRQLWCLASSQLVGSMALGAGGTEPVIIEGHGIQCRTRSWS